MALLAVAWAEWSLYRGIRLQATCDETRPADAIVVFGAAQYNGTPSPVFKARLDHAFGLEERGLAPLVITTGGSGGDPHFTEAGAGLLKQRRKTTCIAVSDGFHLYRIKRAFSAQGITGYGSPAAASPIEADPVRRTLHSLREMLVSTLWYVGIRG